MTANAPSERGFSKPLVIFSLSIAAIAVALLFFGGHASPVRPRILHAARDFRALRNSLPAGRVVAGRHDGIRDAAGSPCSRPWTKSSATPIQTWKSASSSTPDFPAPPPDETGQQPYSVTGTTIRTKLNGQTPQLPAAADAEALLYAAWGKPGNAQIARWTAFWLVGEWRGAEIGMAAAQVEQRLGHKKLASLLVDPGGEISSPDDQTLLGAAWISEIAEFGGAGAVRKLYAAKMPHPNVAEVTKALGTTPLELDRKWQLWMYAYLAGMPSTPHDSGMPMDMPMAGSH